MIEFLRPRDFYHYLLGIRFPTDLSYELIYSLNCTKLETELETEHKIELHKASWTNSSFETQHLSAIASKC